MNAWMLARLGGFARESARRGAIAALLAAGFCAGCGSNDQPAPDAAADARSDLAADATPSGDVTPADDARDAGQDASADRPAPSDAAPDGSTDATAPDGSTDATAPDGSTDATAPDDALWGPVPPTVTASVGASGGTVRLGGFTLTIPPGALSAARDITVERAVDAPPDGYLAWSPLYYFSPRGLTFAVPVTVSIPYPSATGTPTVFWSLADDSGFEDVHGTRVGATVQASVTHFSTGFVGVPLPPSGSCAVGTDYCFNVQQRRRCTARSPAGDTYTDNPCPVNNSCVGAGTCLPRVCALGTATCAGPATTVYCDADGLTVTHVPCPSGTACGPIPGATGAMCITRVCTPGAFACANANARTVCNPDGLGFSAASCGPGATCSGAGMCTTRVCVPGVFSCGPFPVGGPITRLQCSTDGTFQRFYGCRGGAMCTGAGECTLPPRLCTPGVSSCLDINTRRVCNPDGMAYVSSACPASNACLGAGVCTPWMCTPGTATCAALATRRACNPDGQAFANTACPASNACLGAGVCTPWTCTPGAASCADPTTRRVCNPDGQASTSTACPATFGCAAGVCDCVTVGTTACGGVCVNRMTDAANCGSCGRACATMETCLGGVCNPVCGAGQTLCPGAAGAPGACRTLATDSLHCGMCGNACTTGRTCVAGVCTMACAPGTVTCGATPCVDLTTDPANCSACGTVCPGTTNGRASCAARACGITCDTGYVRAGSTCTLPAPRAQAPLPTATVTAARPTLRWILATGATAAHVALCRDRALATGCVSFDAVGTSGTPAAALAAGVWYWQLTGRAGTTNGTATSPVWAFTVRARSATVDTSWGTTTDFNGDGYSDVAIGAVGANRVYVYPGSATGLAATPDRTLTGTGGFGTSVASAGDVNGDGFADLVVGAPNYGSTTAGHAYVYLGSATGLPTTASATLTNPDPQTLPGPPDGRGGSNFGGVVATAGDVNGDGYSDVLVTNNGYSGSTGRAFVYLGGATGLAATAGVTLNHASGGDPFPQNFGASGASVGDVNADGYGDVVIGTPGAREQLGAIYVFQGSATGLATTPARSQYGADLRTGFGEVVASGDFNGDGAADIVASARREMFGQGSATVFLGPDAGMGSSSTSLRASRDPDGAGLGFGASLVADDFNGDGYADLTVGSGGRTGSGILFIHLGSPTGVPFIASAMLTSPDAGDSFGSTAASGRDVNNDGYADLILGSSTYSSSTGRARIYLGASTGLPTAASTTLSSPGATGGRFGNSVARADFLPGHGLFWRWASRRGSGFLLGTI
jgi:hypothetical protein